MKTLKIKDFELPFVIERQGPNEKDLYVIAHYHGLFFGQNNLNANSLLRQIRFHLGIQTNDDEVTIFGWYRGNAAIYANQLRESLQSAPDQNAVEQIIFYAQFIGFDFYQAGKERIRDIARYNLANTTGGDGIYPRSEFYYMYEGQFNLTTNIENFIYAQEIAH